MSDTARHIVRYGIPGSILLITASAVYLLLRMTAGVSLTEASGPIRDNLPAAVGVALSIPLGFISYHVYYWRYTPLGYFRVVSLNPGHRLLRVLAASQRQQIARTFSELVAEIDDANLEKDDSKLLRAAGFGPILDDPLATPPLISRVSRSGSVARRVLRTQPRNLRGRIWNLAVRTWPRHHWKELATPDAQRPLFDRDWANAAEKARAQALHRAVRRLHSARWRAHYLIVSTLGDVVAMREDPSVRAQWNGMTDIYHGLGATRMALLLGLSAGILLNVLDALTGERGPADDWSSTLGGSAFLALLFVAVLIPILNTVRGRAQQRSAIRLGFALRSSLARDQSVLADLGAP